MAKDFKVVGYMPAWKTNKITKIRYDVLTHVIYSFAYPDENGDIVVPNANKVNDIIALAHKENVKVILSFGGWNDFGESNKDFMKNMIFDRDKMDKVIEDLVLLAYNCSFDGVDVNWGSLGNEITFKDEIKDFTQKLSKELHDREMTLSLSVFGSYDDSNDIISFEIASCQSDVVPEYDWINVISYEQREGVRATNTNLKMEGGFKESIVIPNEKTVIGIPFFVNVSAMAYSEDIKECRNTDEFDADIVTCGREIYCLADDEFVSKVQWAKRNAIGLNIWEVTQDFNDKDKSLISKIKENI